MSEYNQTELTEEQIAEREERFRYTDRTHPLIQLLFHFQPIEDSTEKDTVS